MDLLVIASEELSMLSKLAGIALKNKTNDKWHHVKLTCVDNRLTAHVFNGNESASCTLLGESDSGFLAALPAVVVQRFASSDDDLILKLDNGILSYKQGKASGEIQTVDADTIPDHKPVDMSDAAAFDGEQIVKAFAVAAGCADSGAQARFACQGAQLVLSSGELKVRATDGRKAVEFSIDTDSDSEFQVITPTHALGIVCSAGSRLVKIKSESPASVTFSSGDFVYTAVALAGKFPDFSRVLVKPETGNQIKCDSAEFLNAVDAVTWGDHSFVIHKDRLESVDGTRECEAELSDDFDQMTVAVDIIKPVIKPFSEFTAFDAGNGTLYFELGKTEAVGMVACIGGK